MKKIYHNKHKILTQYYQGVSPAKLLEEYHIPSSTLFYWITKYPKEVVTKSKKERQMHGWSQMISHTKKIESEISFLQRTVVQELSLRDKMAIIDKEYGKEGLNVQCEALNVDRGSYLNHKYRNKGENAWFRLRKAKLSENIVEIHEQSGRVYGAAKITAILKARGNPVSEKYVRRLMNELGLRSTRSSSNKDTLFFERHAREAGAVGKMFHPTDIDQVWITDTTPVTIKRRRYYICAYLDFFSRKIVGIKIGYSNSTWLTKQTFLEAVNSRKPKSLTLHSDNGSCYTSYGFEKCLRQRGVVHSYSRFHVPHDNAAMESFFGTLKREGIFINGYPRSKRELEESIAIFVKRYNQERPHQNLNYITPDEFEKRLKEKKKKEKQNDGKDINDK